MQTPQIVLDKWQEEALAHKGNLLLCTGRQVGKTYILSRKAAERMIEKKTSILVASLTEDQAKLIITMTLIYLEQNYRNHIKYGKEKPTQNRIILKNGSSMIARPVGTTGDALRGFTGDVFIPDEMSRMPALVWSASLPTLLTSANPEIWGASTPFGKRGYFWECFQNKNKFWKVIHINSEEVTQNRKISDYWTEKRKAASIAFIKQRKEEMSELEYGQEYLGLFLDELRQYISDEMIAKVMKLKRPAPPLPVENNVMGVDIARLGGDSCVYAILHKSGDIIKQVENVVKKKQLTTQTERKILELNRIWQTEKIGIDAGSGSLGVGIFDRLIENPETRSRVIAMNNRTISLDKEGKSKQRLFKEDMYENLLSMMEKGEIELLNDPEIAVSLRSVQWELITNDGITKVRISGSDTHIAEALARAAYLAKKLKLNKLWISCF